MTPELRTAARAHVKRLLVFAKTDTVGYLEMALDALETTDNLHQIAIDCAEESVRRLAEEESENNTQRDCIHKMQQHIDAQDKRIAELESTNPPATWTPRERETVLSYAKDTIDSLINGYKKRIAELESEAACSFQAPCTRCQTSIQHDRRIASLERRIRAQQAWLTHCDETAPIHDCHWTCPDGSEGMPVCDDGKPIAAEYLASVEAAHCQC